MQARVEDIARVILDGAMPFQIGPYVSEQEKKGEPPWTLPDGAKPLSSRHIRRLVRRAEALIAEAARTNRTRLLQRHLAQRRALFARALNSGQLDVALGALRDEAALLGIYPSEDDELKREAETLRKQLRELKEAQRGGGNDGTASDGGPTAGTSGPAERGEGDPPPGP